MESCSPYLVPRVRHGRKFGAYRVRNKDNLTQEIRELGNCCQVPMGSSREFLLLILFSHGRNSVLLQFGVLMA